VASGSVKEIRYADISTQLISWDDLATSHGGIALVEVTSYVTRAGGPEPPQTTTYRFRLHRHFDLANPHWLAVDFFRPDVGRWVTDLAGTTLALLEAGHA